MKIRQIFKFFIASILCLFLRIGTIHAFPTSLPKGLEIDLKDPTYHDGVISTNFGGVIKGKELYLQAQDIRYVFKTEDGRQVNRIEGEGKLLFQYKNRTYVGDRVEFDLLKAKITVINGCTQTGNWFVGGKKIYIHPDGSSTIIDGYMTSSENEQDEWSLKGKKVFLDGNKTIKAKNVSLFLSKIPVFWIPSFSTDIQGVARSPVSVRLRHKGTNKLIVGLQYRQLLFENVKARLLLDVSVQRGIAGGFDVNYKDPLSTRSFNWFNYYAHDLQVVEKTKKNRYRSFGKYTDSFFDGKISCKATYDKLSDPEVPSDYLMKGIKYGRVTPTQLTFSNRHEHWIARLNAKVRINDFQAVKQELPMFDFNVKPYQLGSTNWIINNNFSAGYLDYLYARETSHVHNFHSSRIQLSQQLYRNYTLGHLNITPKVGYNAISYSNSPQSESRLLAAANFGIEVNTRLIKNYSSVTHSVVPYVSYEHVTKPTVTHNKHYIFDLQDGYGRLNTVRFGARNYLTATDRENFEKMLMLDLYGRAFYSSNTIGSTVPRVYLDGKWKATSWSTYSFQSAWDTQHNILDHLNIRGDVTVTDDIAFGLEYRHRSPYAWRKVDVENFILDSVISEHRLRHSQVSDKRDTFLTNVFFRLSPTVILEFKTRNGWNRFHCPKYLEYEVDLTTVIGGALRVTFSYQHRRPDDRFDIQFRIGGSSGHKTTKTEITRIGHANYNN